MISNILVEEKLHLVRDKLKTRLPSLVALGYIFSDKSVIASNLVGNVYEFAFMSSTGNLKVTFCLSLRNEIRNRDDLLDIFVENLPRRENFSLSSYYKYRHLPEQLRKLRTLCGPDEDFATWLDTIFNLANNAFLKEISDILAEKRWERIPMDLFGYK